MPVKILKRHSQIWSYAITFILHSLGNADEVAHKVTNQGDRILISNHTHTRVIGGTFAPIDEYPWFARATLNKGGTWDGCGGSLVSPSFVLTAAHCISKALKKKGGYDVGSRCYGNADTNKDNCGQSGNEYREVDWVWKDPNHDKGVEDDYDYALVRLSSPITTIEPVAMNTDSAIPNGGQEVIGMGFGATDVKGKGKSLKLLHVTVDALTPTACKKLWGKNEITAHMVCAVRKGKDTCSGDSGGPLVTKSEPHQLIGVNSFGGNKCASLAYPGVYARVSTRYETLKEVICDNTPSSHPKASFCTTNPPGPTPGPTPGPPTTKSPTTVTGPSDCPGSGDCPGSTTMFKLKMLTDKFGDDDNFWYLKNKEGNKKILDVKEMKRRKVYKWCSCVPKGKYQFVIHDKEGDGFLKPGYLKLEWNGKKILDLNHKGNWSKKKANMKAE